MSEIGEKLSAYLDGELPDEEAARLEALLESDDAVRAEFDALMNANAHAVAEFDEMLREPVPLHLARVIERTDLPGVAEEDTPPAGAEVVPFRPTRRWMGLAASLALIVGGTYGGFLAGRRTGGGPQVASVAPWLQDIADYHAVYAGQVRHLVEVPAEESDHIEAWLGKTTNTAFAIPDLTDRGLTFQGGRLLVAAAQPVAQLMYTDADGVVVALCLKGTDKPDGDGFASDRIGAFDLVSWRRGGADYVVVGPAEMAALPEIAEVVAARV